MTFAWSLSGPGRTPRHPQQLHTDFSFPRMDTCLHSATCPFLLALLGLDLSPLLLTCYHEHGTMNLGVTLQKRSVESEGARSMSHGESGLLCSDQAFLGPHCNLQWEGLREEDHTCFVSFQGSQLGTVGRREWDRCLLGIYSMPGPLSRLLNPRSRRWW